MLPVGYFHTAIKHPRLAHRHSYEILSRKLPERFSKPVRLRTMDLCWMYYEVCKHLTSNLLSHLVGNDGLTFLIVSTNTKAYAGDWL